MGKKDHSLKMVMLRIGAILPQLIIVGLHFFGESLSTDLRSETKESQVESGLQR